jgi:hypothetical protein
MEWLRFVAADFPDLLNLYCNRVTGEVVLDAQC